MSNIAISKVSLADLPTLTASQFCAFANGPLHAVIHPHPTDTVEQHTKAIVHDGDGSVFLKATDSSSGEFLGALKWRCYPSGHHYTTDAGITTSHNELTETQAYRQDILVAIFQKRNDIVAEPHARES